MNASAALLAVVCLAVGGAGGWLARSRWTMTRSSHDPAAPFTVEATIRIPGLLFAAPIYGLGLEVSGLLVSELTPPAPDDGIDGATGLPWGGSPGNVPPGEE